MQITLSLLFSFNILFTILAAMATETNFIQMETANLSHSTFRRVSKPPADTPVQLEFRIRQNNLDALEKLTLEISTPGNEKYGKHLTKQQLDDMTANPTGQAIVDSFLASINAEIIHKSSNGLVVSATATVAVWDAALSADFSLFQNDKADEVIRTPSYSLPADVAKEVVAVFNTVQFPAPLFGGPKRVHSIA